MCRRPRFIVVITYSYNAFRMDDSHCFVTVLVFQGTLSEITMAWPSLPKTRTMTWPHPRIVHFRVMEDGGREVVSSAS